MDTLLEKNKASNNKKTVGEVTPNTILIPYSATTPETLDHINDLQNKINEHTLPLQAILNIAENNNGYTLTLQPAYLLSLRERYQYRKPNTKAAINIISNTLTALKKLHDHNIIYQQLTPDNITINNRGEVLFLIKDKCLATTPNQNYIAPEQITHSAISPQTDYYALGCLLYEMLTGSPPFKHHADADSPKKIYHAHCSQSVAHPKKSNNAIPSGLAQLTLDLLEKDPALRPSHTSTIHKILNEAEQNIEEEKKLYGLDREICALQNKTREFDPYRGNLILISGHAGTGKTALLNRATKSCDDITFVYGKFGQYERDIPYFALKQALNSLIENIIQQKKKNQFNKELNNIAATDISKTDIATLSSIMPNIDKLIKDTLPSNIKSKDLLIQTLDIFIQIINRIASPVVIALDDIHWADNDSIHFITTLIAHGGIKNATLILLYRDNEPDAPPLLQNLVKHASHNDISISHIQPGNLTRSDIIELILDSTDSSSPEILAEIIFEKTQGNPLFTQQALASLPNKRKNPPTQELHIEDTLEKTLTRRASQLPGGTLELLKVCACAGTKTAIPALASIMHTNAEHIISIAQTAKNDGFIDITDNSIAFTHDRFRQASYSLITQQESAKIHWAIYSADNSRSLHAQAEHLIKGRKHLTTEQIEPAIQLLISAINLSIQNLTYTSATQLATAALNITHTNKHIKDNTYYALRYSAALSYYLTGNYQAAINLAEKLISKPDTLSIQQKSLYYSLYKNIIVNQQSDFKLALTTGIKILNTINIPNIDITLDNSQKYSSKINTILKNTTDNALLRPNRTTPISHTYCIHILNDIWEAAYYAGDTTMMSRLVTCSTLLSLTQGSTPESPFSYTLYSSMLSLQGKVDQAYKLGKVALTLNTEYNNKEALPKVTNIFCNYTNYKKKNFSSSARLYQQSLSTAIKNGDYLFGVWAAYFEIWSLLLSGANLNDILIRSQQTKDFVIQSNDQKMIMSFEILQTFIENLLGRSPDQFYLSGVNNSIEECLLFWKQNNFLPGTSWYTALDAMLMFIYDKPDRSVFKLLNTDYSTDPGIIMFPIEPYYIFTGLNIINVLRKTPQHPSKTRLLVTLYQHSEHIEKLSSHCPENFFVPSCLLKAGISELNGATDSKSLYTSAIDHCKSIDNPFLSSICYQQYAKYLKANAQPGYTAAIENTITQYTKWGARRKTQDLLTKHSDITLGVEPDKEQTTSSHIQPNLISQYDASSILSISKSISSELDINRLLKKISQTLAEVAGAHTIALIQNTPNGPIILNIEKNITTEHEHEHEHQAISEIKTLPVTVINHAIKQKTVVLLNDAYNKCEFSSDPYIQASRTKSILVIPIIENNDVFGAIYLENPFISGLFTNNHIYFLHILISQAMPAIHNATRYKELTLEIEHRITAENKLRETEARLRLSQRLGQIGTWEWDITSGVIFWSELVSTFLGYKKNIPTSSYENFISRVHPDDVNQVEEAITACFEGIPYRMQHRIIDDDNNIRWVAESGDVIKDENNQPIRMLGTIRDITDIKNALTKNQALENKLQHAQKMDIIGRLTGGIAHDFNNILASIIGYSSLAQEKFNTSIPETLSRYLDEIERAGERGKDIISSITAFSKDKGSNLQIESVSIASTTDEVISLLRPATPSSILIEHEILDDTHISFNSTQMHQIILNLCLNAIASITAHGRIKISLDKTDTPEQTCTSCHQSFSGTYMSLTIQDNGCGIDTEIINKIFEPFYTTRYEGAGMGLSMVHGILHDNNAHITVSSTLSLGSSFTCYFSLSDNKTVTPSSTTTSQINTHTTPKTNILVIDDEKAISELIKDSLELKGYHVTAISNSRQALNIFLENTTKYDIIITDQSMPHITGTELASLIKQARPDIPIILCTGNMRSLDTQSTHNTDLQKIFSKPVDLQQLASAINELTKLS